MAATASPERISINLRADATSRDLDRPRGRGAGQEPLGVHARRRPPGSDGDILDQRLFLLDNRAYRKFTAALDAAPSENPRLQRLLKTRAPWER